MTKLQEFKEWWNDGNHMNKNIAIKLDKLIAEEQSPEPHISDEEYREYWKDKSHEESKPTAPINLTELKLWIIKERDRLDDNLTESFFVALCNKIDEITAKPVAPGSLVEEINNCLRYNSFEDEYSSDIFIRTKHIHKIIKEYTPATGNDGEKGVLHDFAEELFREMRFVNIPYEYYAPMRDCFKKVEAKYCAHIPPAKEQEPLE